MDNPFDVLTRALNEAKEIRRVVTEHGNSMLALLDGNLHGLSAYRLGRIKRQLREFNIHTGNWKG